MHEGETIQMKGERTWAILAIIKLAKETKVYYVNIHILPNS